MRWNTYFTNNCNICFLKMFAFLFHNNQAVPDGRYIWNKQSAQGIKLLIWTVNENKATWSIKMFSFMLIYCRKNNKLQPLLFPLTYLGYFTWLWNGLIILPPTVEYSEEGKKNMYLLSCGHFLLSDPVLGNTKDIV